jgi:hypothetical protein
VERERERLVYLFGEEALADLDDYDLDDESDLMEVVDRFLPVPARQPAAGARAAGRTIAVTQILNDDPPETWRAVERMREAGLERDAVLGQLAMVISANVIEALSTREPVDPARLVAGFDELPMPTVERVAEALVAVARAQPGIGADDVEQALAKLGSGPGGTVVESLVDRVLDRLTLRALHWLAGDLTVVFYDTIAGRTFTHRLTDAEHELEVLAVSVDLAAFGRFDTVRLADGTDVDQISVESGHLGWRGPDGWLAQFQPGDLLAVTAASWPCVGRPTPGRG